MHTTTISGGTCTAFCSVLAMAGLSSSGLPSCIVAQIVSHENPENLDFIQCSTNNLLYFL